VSAGQATLSLYGLAVGGHTLSAQYGGDGANAPSGSGTVGVTVNPPGTAPAITSANSTTFTVGSHGTFTVTTTGSPTPAITATGTVPSGVTIVDEGDGTAILSGTPTTGAGGVYTVTLTAHNTAGPDASQVFTLTVDEGPGITSAATTTATAGTGGSFVVTTRGYPTPSLTATLPLPAGVTFSDNGNGTATLTVGTTAQANPSIGFTITAHNGVGADATQPFTLVILAPRAGADLGVTLRDLSLTPSGGLYAATITNTGSAPTTGTITLTDALAPQLTPWIAAGLGWVCHTNGATVVCTTTHALNPGKTTTVLIAVRVRARAGTTITNRVTVAPTDPTPADNTATVKATVPHDR
jgi:hypothetical protein